MSLSKRYGMIDKEYSGLSIVRQCKLLKVSRSSVYYTRAEHDPITLALMRVMGLEALYKKPNTSKKHPEHRVYPYLLRGISITRPNQVWCSDITYKGHL